MHVIVYLMTGVKGHVTIGLKNSPQSHQRVLYIYILLNLLVHYYDCDP